MICDDIAQEKQLKKGDIMSESIGEAMGDWVMPRPGERMTQKEASLRLPKLREEIDQNIKFLENVSEDLGSSFVALDNVDPQPLEKDEEFRNQMHEYLTALDRLKELKVKVAAVSESDASMPDQIRGLDQEYLTVISTFNQVKKS